ncbi:efflux transporter outer membrane subunit [bacterium SCSIO 12696]|nr:efflux transporter outer membrane subunit [bacterium SCSIO 12696]
MIGVHPKKLLGPIVGLATLVLAGCAVVGPDYDAPPKVDVPDAWNHQLGGSAQDLSQWWQQLNDPALESLIARANSSSLDLRIALARIEEASAQYGVASSASYPSVDVIGSARRSSVGGDVVDIPVSTDDFEAIGSSLAWEIDLFGRIRRQQQAAKAQFEATVEGFRGVQVSLNAEVAQTYVEVRTLQKRLELASKNVSNQRETLKVVKARYKAELTSELDVNQAEQNLAGSESSIPQLNAGLARAVNRLAVLLGQNPGALNTELSKIYPIPVVPDGIALSIPREILRQRPDIRRAERQLAAQTARVGVATANLYPRLSLSGIFAATGSSSESTLWSFGPNLSWNIFDASRKRRLIDIEDARVEQARAAYEKTVLAAFEDVESGLIGYQQELQRLKYLNKSVGAAQKTVNVAKSQYKNGLTNFQTVLDAERVLFAEEDRLANSQGMLVRYLVSIYRAMGGGWSQAQAIELNAKETK